MGKAVSNKRDAASPAFWPSALGAPLLFAALGAALILLLSQLPTRHGVDIGGRDAAYTQGFYDPEPAAAAGLDGANGGARWSRPEAALLFPQAGLPGSVTIRLRGWRESGPLPEVTLLLNGETELARFQASGAWQEQRVAIDGGWLKASDFFVAVRATPATLADGRVVGVLVDRVEYSVGPGPVLPYPSQLAYGAAVGLLLALLLRPAEGRWSRAALLGPALGLGLYGLAWLLLYRSQPLYGYPVRGLPLALGAALATGVVLRDGPRLAARTPWLVAIAAPLAVIGGWTTATLVLAQSHVTLARPGVENDFRVFATRETLAQVFSADGFYNLGYPLLLWIVRPLFEGNAFLAGRLIAALAGALTLAGGYWLARSLLPPGPALVALIALALSGLVAQYGLYLGSDMPLAAGVALSVAALVAARRATGRRRLWLAAFAGLCGGLAFLMRHPGLLLLPWGVLALLALGWRDEGSWRGRLAAPLAFAAAFLLAMGPQLVVNTAQAGQPLYNQQAKNIWLAVYGGTDWGRWDEAPNDISLGEVLLRDPARFLGNWWRNIVTYTGSGAEDTSEFGRALQLRLLGWPANWLAIAGLLGWLLLAAGHLRPQLAQLAQMAGRVLPERRAAARRPRTDGQRLELVGDRREREWLGVQLALLGLIGLYVAAVSTAFTLQRFFLPLAPLYALAAGWTLWRLAGGGRALLGATLALVVVLWGGFGAGAGYVLATQPADEVAAVALVQSQLPPGETMAARISARVPLDKYSAIAHLVAEWPAGADSQRPVSTADLRELAERGIGYLLWDEAEGPPPSPAQLVGSSGRYGLYRIE